MEREPTSKTEELKIDVNGTMHRGQRVVLVGVRPGGQGVVKGAIRWQREP